MKRRKAIGSMLLAGTVTTLGVGGYEWYFLAKTPDKNYILSKQPLLEELAETIIPATDTPGAKEAGAVRFMIPFLNECTDKRTLNKFVKGLQDLENYTSSTYHKTFFDCSEMERHQVLHYFDQKSTPTHSLFEKVRNYVTGYPFFATLKKYTVYGYCISEKGATQGLRYLAVPGKFLACIPLESNQKGWATK
jgi:Gluconate 2-dehydrogenase subunit 3